MRSRACLKQVTKEGINMKRFHVHVAVTDIESSVRFYSALFGADPTVKKFDYAKWMVDDPRINFAISKRGNDRVGINHLGLQVESDGELEVLRGQAEKADVAAFSEQGSNCCYAKSNKYWYTDPQGVAWETYHTLGQIEFFGGDQAREPAQSESQPQLLSKSQAGCCGPKAIGAPAVEIPAAAAPPIAASAMRAAGSSCC